MNRTRFNVVIIVLLLSATGLVGQTKADSQDKRQPVIQPPSPSSSARDLEIRADSLRAEKHYLDAIDYYVAVLQKSDTAIVRNKIGIAFLLLSKYSDARRQFERAIEMDGSLAEAHNNLGVIYYANNRYSSAIKEYHRAIQLNANSAPFHSNLGNAYFSNKNFDGAIREYARAMEIDAKIFDPAPSGGVSVKLAAQGDRAYFDYVIATMYGRKGDEADCRLYLSKANEYGYPRIKDALKDSAFAELRKNTSFVEFVRALRPLPQEARD